VLALQLNSMTIRVFSNLNDSMILYSHLPQTEVSVIEVIDKINKMNRDKSPAPDSTHPRVQKELAKKIAVTCSVYLVQNSLFSQE